MVNRFFLSVASGKKLIAEGIASLPAVTKAMMEHTVVIISGTTNAEVAAALLNQIGEDGFDPRGFFRGASMPKGAPARSVAFDGDVIIEKGKWLRGKTIFDVADSLTSEDLIVKGANALHLPTREAGVLIGNPALGTLGASLAPVIGRGVRMITPVGLEKRVELPIRELMRLCNQEGKGPRLCVSPGEVYTELNAIRDLYGVEAEIVSAGGIAGGEGGIWFAAEGDEEQLTKMEEGIGQIERTPAFVI